MANEICLYICITVIVIVLILSVAHVATDGVSYRDMKQCKREYEIMREEVRRLQIQCNKIYEECKK